MPTKLVRFGNEIKSFAFLIKFRCHTSHARSFINQLRPLFLLRDLIVSRSVVGIQPGESPTISSPFGNGINNNNFKTPLPIVKNVNSTFTLLIEYIYQVDRDFESSFSKSFINEKLDRGGEEVLNKLLDLYGNNKIKIKDIFPDREIR